jgi:uracil-DNA glycosylase
MISWEAFLKQEFEKPYFIELSKRLKRAYAETKVYPVREEVFHAFACCPYEQLKVVIIGQDPYHQVNQAHGLAFSVKKGNRLPPSLRNILLELQADMGCPLPSSGDLSPWAKQGVLLLNTILTVEESRPLAHQDFGWQIFTDEVLRQCNQHPNALVFILWGKHAQSKLSFIDQDKHHVIMSVHPSPLSAHQGFFGSRPFSKCNAYLTQTGQKAIEWCL